MKRKNLLLTCLLAALAFGGVMAQETLPYSYGFENNNLAGEGWTISTGSNGAINKGNNPRNGDYHFRFRSTGTADTYQYLFSRELPSSVGINVQFYYYRSGTINMTFNVGYSTTNTDPESFTFLETDITVSNLSYNDNIYFSHDFNVADIKYIAIKYTNFTGTWVYLYIDDITISELSSSCTTPTDLSAEATSSTTANISWTAGNTETAWQLYSTSLDYALPQNAAEGDIITINTTPSYTITGLNPNNEYFVYVRAKCGEEDFSDWTDAVSFTTLNPQSLPVFNDFEDGDDALEYWTVREAHANTGIYNSGAYDGSSYCFRFYSTSQGITQYLITPELSGTSNGVHVQFYRKQGGPGAWLQVGYSTETSSTEDFIWSEATPNASTGDYYVSYELNCPAGTKFVAIKYTATGMTWIYIDNISITVPPTATTDGNWNNTAIWTTGEVPSSTANVVISSNVTIPNGYTATANEITIDGGFLTIADGGQLICNNAVEATLQKGINAALVWGTPGADAWYFIASPVDGYATSNVIITGITDTDLYSFDEESGYWLNGQGIEPPFTTLTRGQGYLYANSTGDDLSFLGTMPATNTTIEKPLSFAGSGSSKGFNLMGNPFTCNLTSDNVKIQDGETQTSITTYYIVEDGTELATMNLSTDQIKPGRGFLIQADKEGQKLVFNPAAKRNETKVKPSFIRIEAGDKDFMDRAYVQIGSGNTLRKMTINDNVSHVYVMSEGKDYAAATIQEAQGEMPLNFKAAKNGQYTITVNPENVALDYLHLVDNLTGADIDLLSTPSYTFNAKTTDYASRFRLLFAANGIEENGTSTSSANFAFISNGQLIVNGTGTLQIIDMTGRVVSTKSTEERISTNELTPGVYVVKLIGNETKTQKIVIE